VKNISYNGGTKTLPTIGEKYFLYSTSVIGGTKTLPKAGDNFSAKKETKTLPTIGDKKSANSQQKKRDETAASSPALFLFFRI